ncbi:MAG: hypothetical protein WCD69_07855 [Xanthobacteraceae bacterium]
MAIRVARGLFRLWLVFAILWCCVLIAMTWKQFVYFVPTAPSKPNLQETSNICARAGTATACADLLKAAGRNPFDAWDLKWDDKGWTFPDDTTVRLGGVTWERVPIPALMLVIGATLGWAFSGFRGAREQ